MLILENSKYENLLNSLKLYLCNKNIILSANFLRLGLPKFDLNHFLNIFQSIINPKNIAIQTFSEFPNRNNRVFSRFHTPVTKNLSSLSKYAFKNFPERRVLSPTHSFVLLNKQSGVDNKIFHSAFGEDSFFSYLLNNDFYWLNLGSFLSETCTFMHHVESMNSELIPYRENKTFQVKVFQDKNQKKVNTINYEYFTRKSNYSSFKYNWLPIQNDVNFKNNIFFIEDIPISFYSLEDLFNKGTKFIKTNNLIFITNL